MAGKRHFGRRKGFLRIHEASMENASLDDGSNNKENETPNSQASSGSSSSTSAVKDLVVQLLDQWRHEHPHKVVHMNSTTLGQPLRQYSQ